MNMLSRIAATLVVAGAAGSAVADITPVYVNASATGANNGSTWADAYTDLRAALGAAPAGAQIWIAQGVYYPGPAGSARTVSFVMRSGVALYGGFAGGETTLAERDPLAHPTTLSGDLGRNDPANRFDNALNVLTATGVDASAMLDGLVVRGGSGSGGALRVLGGGPTVRGCIFIDNAAMSGEGGAVYASTPATLSFTDCRFEGNSTGQGVSDWGAMGGAMSITGGTITIDRCLFLGNRTGNGAWGGCAGGNPMMGAPGGFGGAVGLRFVTGAITNSRFIGNRTGDGGIGASCSRGTAPAGAGGSGAAVFALGGPVTVVNCVFDSNRAGAGGPATSGPSGPVPAGQPDDFTVYVQVSPVVAQGTFVNNRTASNANLDLGRYTGVNAIVWTPADPGTPVDPRFVDADGADNVLGTADDDLRLSLASPFIDAGDNALVPVGIVTDAAGRPRFRDIATVPDTGAGTPPIVDLGAYETQPCRADFNGSGRVSVQDLFDFLAAYFGSASTADIDDSGTVSVEDLFAFLALYFAAC